MCLCERNGSEQTYSDNVLYFEQETPQEHIPLWIVDFGTKDGD